MHRSDRVRLRRHSLGAERLDVYAFRRALESDVDDWSALVDAIYRDLSPGSPWGIGWWSKHLDARRRVLIGDYLYVVSRSVTANLLEARLSLSLLREARDRFQAHLRRTLRPGRVVRFERPSQLEEHSHKLLLELHWAGVARALGSVFDCLGATIIGVCGLPLSSGPAPSILRVGWNDVLKAISRVPADSPHRLLLAPVERTLAAAEAVHKPGWIEWISDTRNMLVHRARREMVFKVLGDPTSRGFRVVIYPPRDPAHSEVEIFARAESRRFVVEEDLLSTMTALFEASREFVNRLGHDLRDVWASRRRNPDLAPQPANQWKTMAYSEGRFDGNATGEEPFEIESFSFERTMVRRMQAACLMDADRERWREWEESQD